MGGLAASGCSCPELTVVAGGSGRSEHCVTTTTTPFFALPARLSAKADEALIGPDENHFAAISQSLDATTTDLAGRLSAARRSPGGKGQAAMDRDLEIHRLSGRLRTLQRYGVDLCLGRVVLADDPEPVYVGRLGLTDADGTRLLIDWRSPAAEPFFGATHANRMGLVSRRRYRWQAGRVTDYWDEVFTSDGMTSSAALDDQSAFIASLGTDRSDRMRDVLGTIASDQDAIVRRGPRVPSSWTEGQGPVRRSSPYTGRHTCCTPTHDSGTARVGCSSSVHTSPTSPMSPTSSRAWVRRVCRPAPSAISSPAVPMPQSRLMAGLLASRRRPTWSVRSSLPSPSMRSHPLRA